MADEKVEQSRSDEESDEPSNGGDSNGHNIGRVVAIAAASGATAYAARKALESRSSSSSSSGDDEGTRKRGGSGSSESTASLVTAAVSSGWDVAKDSLMPVVEDAATKAGAYVADRAPELVRDVVVPRFIDGFEKRSKRTGKKRENGDQADE